MITFRFAAAAALAAAATLAFADAPTVASDQFSPGWQDKAQSLINQGPAHVDMAKTSWYVPGNASPGRYVLIERHGDSAQVIDGYGFRVLHGQSDQQIHVILPTAYANVEALPIDFVPAMAAQQRGHSDTR